MTCMSVNPLVSLDGPSLASFSLSAGLSLGGGFFYLFFRLDDTLQQARVSPFSLAKKENEIIRKNELWQKTCFELFLGWDNEDSYWEFNFSTEGEWNLYYFSNYREPQPPKEVEDFRLIEYKWMSRKELSVRFLFDENSEKYLRWVNQGLKREEHFLFSLCAVIQDWKGCNHYYCHQGDDRKPDFHQEKLRSLKFN